MEEVRSSILLSSTPRARRTGGPWRVEPTGVAVMSADRRQLPSGMAVVGYLVRRGVYRLARIVSASKARRRPVPDGPALFVYGHSYAALEGATLTPWPVFVADGLGLPLVDRAVGGDVIRETCRRAKVRQGRPGPSDIVLVHIGGNDVLRRGNDPRLAGEVRDGLRRIVGQLGRAGATVRILGEVPLRDWTAFPRRFDRGSDETSAAVHAAGMSFPGAIDLRVGWDPETMLLADGIHPNELGVATLTRTILEALRSTVD